MDCPSCGAITPTGCTCGFASTQSIAVVPDDSALDTVGLALQVHPHPDNVLELIGGGLRSKLGIPYLARPFATGTHTLDIGGGAPPGVFHVQFNTPLYDPYGMHSTEAFDERWVVVRDGWWRINAHLSYTSPSGDMVLRTQMRVNNDRVIKEVEDQWIDSPAKDLSVAISGIFPLHEGDFVSLFHGSFGGSYTLVGGEFWSPYISLLWMRDL